MVVFTNHLRFGDDGGTTTFFLGVMVGSDEKETREMELLRSLLIGE